LNCFSWYVALFLNCFSNFSSLSLSIKGLRPWPPNFLLPQRKYKQYDPETGVQNTGKKETLVKEVKKLDKGVTRGSIGWNWRVQRLCDRTQQDLQVGKSRFHR
jgi:hypothetical protein